MSTEFSAAGGDRSQRNVAPRNGDRPDATPRRAAVVGSPIEHSLSPVLHEAAYRELGLTGWTYQRVERDADGLAEFVAGLGPDWAGLSVTMPGKRAALELAADATERARAVGAANTLVPRDIGEWASAVGESARNGWFADCTDVDGVVGAMRAAGEFVGGTRALVLGAGGTAAAAMAALNEVGVSNVDIVVRSAARAEETVRTARRCGLRVMVSTFAEADLAALASAADIVISTLPAGAADAHADTLARAPCLLDVIYHPWPTPLALAARSAGARLATGLDMLLHQAFGQVEQFTGCTAPRVAMRDALQDASGGDIPLRL